MNAAWPPIWPKIAEKLYIFDPRGDVLLILERRPEEDMAEYIDEGEIEKPTPKEPILEETAQDWLQPEPSAEEPQAEEPVPYEPNTVEPKTKAKLESDSAWPRSSLGSISAANWAMKPKVQEVQMRVSSKHLILASAIFGAYLGSDKFTEGRTLLTKAMLFFYCLMRIRMPYHPWKNEESPSPKLA